MQHRVDGDETEGDFRELAVQQQAGEQRGRTEGMSRHRIRNEEPQRDYESSEESTRHTVDDHCLSGSPHVPTSRRGAADNMATLAATVYRCSKRRHVVGSPSSRGRDMRRPAQAVIVHGVAGGLLAGLVVAL